MEKDTSQDNRGVFVIAANSLGCADDIPNRALSILKTADLVIFEEDRIARQTLKAAGVHRTYLKLSEHEEKQTLDDCKEALHRGETVIYMSDQGCPNVADPGRLLLDIAYEQFAKVVVIPGPSALTAAVAACPFKCDSFIFAGFLPKEKTEREQVLKTHLKLGKPVAIFDTPYRLKNVIESCIEMRINKRIFLALDISGPQENYFLGNAQKILNLISPLPQKTLNFVLIIEGSHHE